MKLLNSQVASLQQELKDIWSTHSKKFTKLEATIFELYDVVSELTHDFHSRTPALRHLQSLYPTIQQQPEQHPI